MNFDFSDEQQELRHQAQRLLGIGVSRSRAHVASGAPYDAELWQKVVEMGWTAAAVPEQHGGLGLGPLELCVLAEEMGRTLAPLPFSSSVLQATEALKLALDSEEGRSAAAEWLPRLAEGEVIGTVALVEPGGRLWSEEPTATVSNGKLSGIKEPVSQARSADIAVVSARADDDTDGYSLWLVDLRDAQCHRESINAVDLIHDWGRLSLDRVAAARLCGPNGGQAIVERLAESLAVFTAFEQIGSAEAVMALALEYVKTRKTFGREVASYQAVKHKLAEMYVRIALARSHAYYGAWAVANDAPELRVAAPGARLAAIDALNYVAEESVHLHGGIGFTWECDAQLFYRQSRALAGGLGGRPYWSRRLIDALASARI